jgi:hypothetical protein
MITGAHSIIYSKKPDADRAFLRDVLKFPFVDVGEGWLIFGLPPAEVAVHPSGKNDVHEFYLMCDDVEAFAEHMQEHGVTCAPREAMGWGILTHVTLPGGGKLGVYQPRHARPKSGGAAKTLRGARPASAARSKAAPARSSASAARAKSEPAKSTSVKSAPAKPNGARPIGAKRAPAGKRS